MTFNTRSRVPNGYVFKLHECLNRIFYDLISAERYVELSEAETNTEKRNMARASQIIDYVERNYAAKPRLEELAVKCTFHRTIYRTSSATHSGALSANTSSGYA